MMPVLVSPRLRKTAEKFSPELRAKIARAITDAEVAFGDPHRHRGLGLRKLGRRSYEIRVHLQWRVVLLRDDETLVAYDVMDHNQVKCWLRGK